jgi:hypothetical protein
VPIQKSLTYLDERNDETKKKVLNTISDEQQRQRKSGPELPYAEAGYIISLAARGGSMFIVHQKPIDREERKKEKKKR